MLAHKTYEQLPWSRVGGLLFQCRYLVAIVTLASVMQCLVMNATSLGQEWIALFQQKSPVNQYQTGFGQLWLLCLHHRGFVMGLVSPETRGQGRRATGMAEPVPHQWFLAAAHAQYRPALVGSHPVEYPGHQTEHERPPAHLVCDGSQFGSDPLDLGAGDGLVLLRTPGNLLGTRSLAGTVTALNQGFAMLAITRSNKPCRLCRFCRSARYCPILPSGPRQVVCHDTQRTNPPHQTVAGRGKSV